MKLKDIVPHQKKMEISNLIRNTLKLRNQYTINLDLSVDIEGNVDLYDRDLSTLPVKFNKVTGYFQVGLNELTSFENFPSYVKGYIDISGNPFTSLEGLSVYCEDTVNVAALLRLPSYHNIHKYIKHAKNITCSVKPNMLGLLLIPGVQTSNEGGIHVVGFDSTDKKVATIFRDYGHDTLACQEALIDAGFIKEAKI